MRRSMFLLAAVLILAVPGIIASQAADPVQPTAQPAAPSAGSSLTTMDETQALRLPPMHQEIRTLLLAERDEVARLVAHMNTLDHPVAALRVQQEISDLKYGTQVAILETQGRFALAEGREEQAEEIATAVARMKDRQATRVARRSER